MPNHLIHENSPYLIKHSNNPVEWYPWGDEAINRARAEDKPIFLSIGYAACHWCHVMEHESFEDPAIAEVMNEYYINIKVDREERPDLDNIYMSATVAMTGSGGWPMSVFLTPDLHPFYTGTYFPPTARHGLPAFKDILRMLSHAWENNRDQILDVSHQVLEHIRQNNSLDGQPVNLLSQKTLSQAAENLYQAYDWRNGGWGNAPKFPQPMAIEFLLQRITQLDPQIPNNDKDKYTNLVYHALHAMMRGGMYDVVGGGFARYSVDATWKTPHFEKMLYDNAQLAQVYLHAYLLSGEIHFRRVCEETLDFILREMTDDSGGFYSSLDADSEGVEGKYYIWNLEEIEAGLDEEEFRLFQAAYGLDQSPNLHHFEGKLILHRSLKDETLLHLFHLDKEELLQKLAHCNKKLLTLREKRIRPAVDDKVLTAWNGLAMAAFAEAGRYLQRPDYLNAAIKNAEFVLSNLHQNGHLLRSWRAGQAKHNACLEDYTNLILGMLALYQSRPERPRFETILLLTKEMLASHQHPQGGFYDAALQQKDLPFLPVNTQDNATPSGNASAALLLLQISQFGELTEYKEIAESMISSVLQDAVQYPGAFSRWLCAGDFAVGPIRQVALIGTGTSQPENSLSKEVWKKYQPHLVFAASQEYTEDGIPALLNQRPLLHSHPTAYLCQGFTCLNPVNSPEELARQLESGTLRHP